MDRRNIGAMNFRIAAVTDASRPGLQIECWTKSDAMNSIERYGKYVIIL